MNRWSRVALVLLALATACGGDPPLELDAGSGVDGGGPGDAGEVDGGLVDDAAAPEHDAAAPERDAALPESCTVEGACVPGTRSRGEEGCPAGSTREMVCTDACELAPVGACEDSGCPTPGALETLACGMCGSQTRFCNVERIWEYGACEGERECTPGTSRAASCGMCGTTTERCDATCTWVGGACTGESGCAPGATMRTSDGCPSSQTRLLRCSASCAFTEVVEPCAAPDVDAGVDAGADAGRDGGPPSDGGPSPVTIGGVQRGEITPGTSVTLRGVVVTAVRSDTVWVQDPLGGGAHAGVRVYFGSAGHTLVRNDLVDVEGTVLEYFDDTEITGATFVWRGTAPAITPRALTVAQAATEAYEGMLVRLTDVTSYVSPYDCSLDDPACFDTQLWQVNGASGILVDRVAYEAADWSSGIGATSVTGVMSWRFGRRRILPRVPADLP